MKTFEKKFVFATDAPKLRNRSQCITTSLTTVKITKIETVNVNDIYLTTVRSTKLKNEKNCCLKAEKAHVSEINRLIYFLPPSQKELVEIILFLWLRRKMERKKNIVGKDFCLHFINGDCLNLSTKKISEHLITENLARDIKKVISTLIRKQ